MDSSPRLSSFVTRSPAWIIDYGKQVRPLSKFAGAIGPAGCMGRLDRLRTVVAADGHRKAVHGLARPRPGGIAVDLLRRSARRPAGGGGGRCSGKPPRPAPSGTPLGAVGLPVPVQAIGFRHSRRTCSP